MKIFENLGFYLKYLLESPPDSSWRYEMPAYHNYPDLAGLSWFVFIWEMIGKSLLEAGWWNRSLSLATRLKPGVRLMVVVVGFLFICGAMLIGFLRSPFDSLLRFANRFRRSFVGC